MTWLDLVTIMRNSANDIGGVLLSSDSVLAIYEYVKRSIEMLISKKIDVMVKAVTKTSIDELIRRYSNGEAVVSLLTTLYLDKHSKVSLLVLMELNSGRRIAEVLLSKIDLELTEDYAIDALREFMNIIAGSYALRLSNIIGKSITYDIPEVIIEIDRAIISELIIPLAIKVNEVIFHDVAMKCKDDDVSMNILIMSESNVKN